MIRRFLRTAAAAAAASLLAAGMVLADQTSPAKASVQDTSSGSNTGLSFGAGSGPLTVDADEGEELHQDEKLVIAHKNAVATRGDRKLQADTITAYYREKPNTNQQEFFRIVADGNVKLSTPTQEAAGDHGVDDLDTNVSVLTGQNLKMTRQNATLPPDVLTARDSLEWYDGKQLAVARGNALAIRGDRRIRADILTAEVVSSKGQPSHISRVDAHGHVFVSRPEQTGTGDKGIYNEDTDIVTLTGHVTLTRGESTMVGDRGVMDLKSGVSHILAGGDSGRVQAYVVPRDRTASPATKSDDQSGAAIPKQKGQTDPAKAR